MIYILNMITLGAVLRVDCKGVKVGHRKIVGGLCHHSRHEMMVAWIRTAAMEVVSSDHSPGIYL